MILAHGKVGYSINFFLFGAQSKADKRAIALQTKPNQAQEIKTKEAANIPRKSNRWFRGWNQAESVRIGRGKALYVC
jgi:hypothetical protein